MSANQEDWATFTAKKQAYTIQISRELLMDDPEYFEAHATPEERARRDEFARRYEALRIAGLLDDEGWEIGPNDCPTRTTVGNYDSTETVRCELTRGHTGSHKFTFEWEPDPNEPDLAR